MLKNDANLMYQNSKIQIILIKSNKCINLFSKQLLK